MNMCKQLALRAAVVSLLVCLACLAMVNSARAITITINGLGSMTAPQQQAFNDAKAFWESVLTGYQVNPFIAGPTINATITAIDGPGGILGSAGPTTGAVGGPFIYTNTGNMTFDSADVPTYIGLGVFDEIIVHEMGHVLGVGTLWSSSAAGAPGFQEFYVTNSFKFTGPQAIAKYKLEFNQPGATFVPVEDNGGPGTANGHWDEINGGAGLTGVTDTQGRDRAFEIMTGWLNIPTFYSNTTIASMADLGYIVNYLNDARITSPTGSPINLGTAIVGSAPSQSLTLNKTGAEATTYSVTANNNGLTNNASGSFVAGSGSQNVSVSLVNNANGSATAGAKAYTITVDNLATNNNGPTVGNNDTNEVFTVNATVLDASQGSFNGVSNLDSIVLNFGSVLQNSTPADLPFSLYNLQGTVGFTAGLDLLSIVGSGDTSTLTTNLATFSGLAANSSNAYLASINTSTLGNFSASYTLNVFDDQNIFGAGAGTPLLLTINGNVFALASGEVPEPATGLLLAAGLCWTFRRRRRR